MPGCGFRWVVAGAPTWPLVEDVVEVPYHVGPERHRPVYPVCPGWGSCGHWGRSCPFWVPAGSKLHCWSSKEHSWHNEN